MTEWQKDLIITIEIHKDQNQTIKTRVQNCTMKKNTIKPIYFMCRVNQTYIIKFIQAKDWAHLKINLTQSNFKMIKKKYFENTFHNNVNLSGNQKQSCEDWDKNIIKLSHSHTDSSNQEF